MKEETIATLVGIILGIIFLGMLFVSMYFYIEKEEKTSNCLEPYALKICQERDLYYSSHSNFVVRCKEDIRDYNSLRFKFNRTELSSCGIGVGTLE